MDIKFNVIHVIDFIVVAIFAYLYLGSTEWELTTFMKIVIAFIVGVAFLALMMEKVIGRILQLILSVIWTIFAMLVVPFDKWTNNNIIWLTVICIVLFLIFFEVHGQGVSSFFEWLEIRRKGMNTLTYLKSQGVQVHNPADPEEMTVQVVKYYSQYMNVQNEFNYLSKQLNDKYHVNIDETEFHKLFKLWDGVFSYMFTELKHDEAKKLEEFIATASAANDKKKQMIANMRDASNRQEKQQGTPTQNKEIDKELFNGCADKTSITKRYHQLMKTFHPDNQNGDTMMTQRIQKTYEAVIKSL